MPEKKGYLWDPMYGILPDVDPLYYDDSLTEPAVVSASLPAKFNGSQEAARRYAEGYRWGRENVRDPREQAAPYVGAGLAATMLAPYAISAAATGATNPWAMQFGKRMLLDLPAFEVMDRLPTLIGQDRATVQAGNLAERGFRALTPDGRFEENVAPYVNQAGQFVGGFVPGMMGDVVMRSGVGYVNSALEQARNAARSNFGVELDLTPLAREAGMGKMVLRDIADQKRAEFKRLFPLEQLSDIQAGRTGGIGGTYQARMETWLRNNERLLNAGYEPGDPDYLNIAEGRRLINERLRGREGTTTYRRYTDPVELSEPNNYRSMGLASTLGQQPSITPTDIRVLGSDYLNPEDLQFDLDVADAASAQRSARWARNRDVLAYNEDGSVMRNREGRPMSYLDAEAQGRSPRSREEIEGLRSSVDMIQDGRLDNLTQRRRSRAFPMFDDGRINLRNPNILNRLTDEQLADLDFNLNFYGDHLNEGLNPSDDLYIAVPEFRRMVQERLRRNQREYLDRAIEEIRGMEDPRVATQRIQEAIGQLSDTYINAGLDEHDPNVRNYLEELQRERQLLWERVNGLGREQNVGTDIDIDATPAHNTGWLDDVEEMPMFTDPDTGVLYTEPPSRPGNMISDSRLPARTILPNVGDAPLFGEHDNLGSVIATAKRDYPDLMIPSNIDTSNRYEVERFLNSNGIPASIERIAKLGDRYVERFNVSKASLQDRLNRITKYSESPGVRLGESLFESRFSDDYLSEIPNLADEDILKIYLSYLDGPQTNHASGAYRRNIGKPSAKAFKVAADELTKRYGIDFSDYENNYDEIAKFIRFSENSPYSGYQYALPGDLGHMYWFQARDRGLEGSRDAFNSAMGLSASVPSGSAITELNTSPDSWSLELLSGLKNYGFEPGQTEVKFLKTGDGSYKIGRRNTLQRGKATIDSIKENYRKKYGDEAAKEFEDYLTYLKSLMSSDDAIESINEHPEYLQFVMDEIKNVREAELKRMNKVLKIARQTTGFEDIPEAKLGVINPEEIAKMILYRGEEYSPRLYTPDIYLIKHKYGGLLNRLRSHYGSDDKIREAIQMARGGKVNKMANGGPEEALHNLASWIGYQTVLKPEINKKGIDEVRLRLYDNLSPFSYDNPVKRVKDALKRPPVSDQERRGLLQNPRANYNDVDIANDMYKYRDDIWRTYLQVPRDKAHGHSAVEVEPSDYRPTKASYEGPYYRLSDYGLKGIRSGLVNEALTGYAYGENGLYSLPVEARKRVERIVKPIGVGESTLSNVLGRSFGTHTISRGIDPQRGEYVSYYDLWDIAPFGARNASDQSHGIGEPIHFYDRIYLDDYFGVKPEIPEDSYYGGYLTPAFVESYPPYENDTFLKDYRSGGKIHIKPENRGKFTALKKRTGHSASWFKMHGTPAQKKMAVFELNSRRWSHKHGDGGYILGGIYDLSEEQIRRLIQQGYEVERV